MKTNLKLLFIFLVLNISAHSQEKWIHSFGESDRYGRISESIQSYDGGHIILSRYYYQEGALWYSYGWLIKTDVNGNVLWEKVIDFPERHFFRPLGISESFDNESSIKTINFQSPLYCHIWGMGGGWNFYGSILK